jgi:hypothetical protein
LFDYKEVTVSSAPPTPALGIRELQDRVHRMQGTAISRPLEMVPAFSGLLQLRTGAAYGVDSLSLAMALMAGPSHAGAWSAVVGAADFGLEAAAELGVDLDRTILVPDPGQQWLSVVAGLIDVATVVVVRPPARVTEHQAARITSRLRQRDAVLIAWGDWPRSEARLTVRESSWQGLGRGYGHLIGRQATVVVRRGTAPPREALMWLPDADQQITLVDCPPIPLHAVRVS